MSILLNEIRFVSIYEVRYYQRSRVCIPDMRQSFLDRFYSFVLQLVSKTRDEQKIYVLSAIISVFNVELVILGRSERDLSCTCSDNTTRDIVLS